MYIIKLNYFLLMSVMVHLQQFEDIDLTGKILSCSVAFPEAVSSEIPEKCCWHLQSIAHSGKKMTQSHHSPRLCLAFSEVTNCSAYAHLDVLLSWLMDFLRRGLNGLVAKVTEGL